jgi:DNA helicase-2/ATP-dependent DNA helicase PcrA
VAHLAGLLEWAEEGGGGDEARRDRREHVDALLRLGHDYLAADAVHPGEGSGPPGAAGFVAYLVAVLAEEDDPTTADAVDLLTFHKSKGLEWPVVHVTGLERGLVPIAYAETPAALAEERRLLYVALTRAERELHLRWARRRTLGGREMSRQASPYLTAIEAALAALAPGGDGDWQAAVAAERARLARAREAAGRDRATVGAAADPGVLAELVAWRKALARASGVPAHVIFHDATLAAVAEARPGSRDALLALPGLGLLKVERYGDELLTIVARASGQALCAPPARSSA